jgi:hypothetical protein
MKALFDQGAPAPLRLRLSQHEVATGFECGWGALENGALLSAAEAGGLQVFITADQNLRSEQKLARRHIASIVLSTTNWPRSRADGQRVLDAGASATAGGFVEASIP